MKLLVVTQAIDTEDPVLGFFARWIEECSKRFEHVEVICLKEGKHALPPNVRVHSLGKERGSVSRVTYVFRFLCLAWKLRSQYDAVFVHMNQEYILICGWLWKLMGKNIYLWRNHYAGSWSTDLAAFFCTKVFCTSKHSYTAKYKKTVLMPVGVDVERFSTATQTVRKPHSILYLARISPSKRPEVLIDALARLAKNKINFSASFYGSPLMEDETYYRSLKEKVRLLGLSDLISFHTGIPNTQTPEVYQMHEIFVNLSPSGMLDKTMFEAIASGCIPLFASADMAEIIGFEFAYADGDENDLAKHLASMLALSEDERHARVHELQVKALGAHTLPVLGTRLAEEMNL